MTEYTFEISYYSEATLQITVTYLPSAGRLKATCSHPVSSLSLNGSWFFFSSKEWIGSTAIFEGDNITDLLDRIAREMYEGVVTFFGDDEDTEFWFRQHLQIAFVLGYLPSKDLRVEVA